MASRVHDRRRPIGMGDRVRVILGKQASASSDNNGALFGRVRFIGNLKFARGKWLGLQLETKGGKNDGSVQGERYFQCEPGYGLFVKPTMVRAAPVEKRRKSSSRPANGQPSNGDASRRARSRGRPTATSSSTASNGSSSQQSSRHSSRGSSRSARSRDRQQAKVSALDDLRKKQARLRKNSLSNDPSHAAARATAAAAAAKPNGAPAGLSGSSRTQNRTYGVATRSVRAGLEKKQANDKRLVVHQQAEQIKALKGDLLDLRTKFHRCQQSLQEARKNELMLNNKCKNLAEENQGLASTVENATLEKQIAEQTAEEMKDDIELLKDQLQNAQLEIEMMRQQQQSNMQKTMASLPTKKQEVAKVVNQNKELTHALRQMRDLAMAEQRKFELFQEQTKRNMDRLTDEANASREKDKVIAKLKDDLKESLAQQDSLHDYQHMVEELTTENVSLKEDARAMKATIKTLTEINEYADQMEEGHQQYEEQLQEEVELAHKENTKLQNQLKVSERRIVDLERAVKQYRELTQELQSQEMVQGMSKKKGRRRSSAKATVRQLKLAENVSKFRAQSVSWQLFELHAQQAARQVAFVKLYLPDRVKVDQSSLDMLLFLERLGFKAELVIKLCDQYYGPSVALVEGKEAGQVAMLVCDVAQTLLRMLHSLAVNMHCLRHTDPANYAAVLGHYKGLKPAEGILDEFLDLIAHDTITPKTPMIPIQRATNMVTKFVKVYFSEEHSNDSDSESLLEMSMATPSGSLASLPNSPPTTLTSTTSRSSIRLRSASKFSSSLVPRAFFDLPSAHQAHPLWLSARMLHYDQEKGFVQMRILTAAVLSHSSVLRARVKEENASANGTVKVSTAGVDPEQLVRKLEDFQLHSRNLVAQVVKQSLRLHEKGGYVFLPDVDEALAAAHRLSEQTASQISSLTDAVQSSASLNGGFAGFGSVRGKRALLKSAFSPEKKDAKRTAGAAWGMMVKTLENALDTDDPTSVCSFFGLLNEALNNLLTEVKGRVDVSFKGNPDERKDNTLAVWEKHAAEVRASLAEAAGLKEKLADSNARIQAKVEAVFAANKKARAAQSKIDMLSQRLKLVESKAGASEDLRAELDRLKRQDASLAEAMTKSQKELEKFNQENKALKKKIASLAKSKLGKARERNNAAAGGMGGPNTGLAYVASNAAAEMNLLAQTVRMLRARLSTATTSGMVGQLSQELPPLPSVARGPPVRSMGQYSAVDRLAMASLAGRRAVVPAHSSAADKLKRLSHDLSKSTAVLRKVRAAPVLVAVPAYVPLTESEKKQAARDLDASAARAVARDTNRRYHKQVAVQTKLMINMGRMRSKVRGVTRHMVTSATPVQPLLPANPQAKVGRITVPIKTFAEQFSADLSLDSDQLQRLLAAFVPFAQRHQ